MGRCDHSMTDLGTSNCAAERRPEAPTPRLIRTQWVLTRMRNKYVTCGIYENQFGRELRTYYGSDESNLLDSLLSRTGDEQLEHRAGELRLVLAQQRWTQLTTKGESS